MELVKKDTVFVWDYPQKFFFKSKGIINSSTTGPTIELRRNTDESGTETGNGGKKKKGKRMFDFTK